MNKSKHSTDIALAIICLLTAACGPSLANGPGKQSLNDKNSRVTGSLYCVQGTVTVKGWEKELIARNPSLEKFHWAPISAARPGKIYFRQPISVNGSKTKPFHSTKPLLISTADVLNAQSRKAQMQTTISGEGRSTSQTRLSTSGSLRSKASTYTATYATYNCRSQLALSQPTSTNSPPPYPGSPVATRAYARLISVR